MDPMLIDLPMPIKTDRLLLRPRVYGEGKLISAAINESLAELKPWMPFAQKPPTPEEAELRVRHHMAEFILRSSITLSMYSPDGATFLGSTGFHRMNWEARRFELGYWIRSSFAGKGYVTEAVLAQTHYLFRELKARRVEIRCDSKNEGSLCVMRKAGFLVEATFKNDDVDVAGNPRDTVVASCVNADSLPVPMGLRW